MEADTTIPPPPKIGDKIYIYTSSYISHACDDIRGGLAKVTSVKLGKSKGGETVAFVTVEGIPKSYNWRSLAEQQEALEEEFGESRARCDPNHDPRFNEE